MSLQPLYIKTAAGVVLLIALTLCFYRSGNTRLLDKAYLGMTVNDYRKEFTDGYQLLSSNGKLAGDLHPGFRNGRLATLAFIIKDISDFDTAYTVYELGNDFSQRYGTPVENKETVWAGGTSKFFKWRKGRLEIEYCYRYEQVQGTSGLLYNGQATLAYRGCAIDN